MKHRKKDKGLSVRCMILLQHSLQRNEPKHGAREEKYLVRISTRLAALEWQVLVK